MFESSAFKPNDKLNWGCKIRDILCKYSFNHVWLSQTKVLSFQFLLQLPPRQFRYFSPQWTAGWH
jgi:hypothetical protein